MVDLTAPGKDVVLAAFIDRDFPRYFLAPAKCRRPF